MILSYPLEGTMSPTVKFTVSVPGRLFEEIETLRAKRGISRSQLVREALRRLGPAAGELSAGGKATKAEVHEEPARYGIPAGPLREITDEAERRRRALAAIGRFRSRVTDLSTEHDKYLDDAYAGGDPGTEQGPDQKP
jgi:Arc/MetJ-type ribon-helix-helix transcriptional regulator